MLSEAQAALRETLIAYVRVRGAEVGNVTAMKEISDELTALRVTGVHGPRPTLVTEASHSAANGQFGR